MIVETEYDPTSELPPSHNDSQNQWQRWIDTTQSPDDIVDWRQGQWRPVPTTASSPDLLPLFAAATQHPPTKPDKN